MNLSKKQLILANILGMSLIFSLLTGCAKLNSDFTCPMKPGQLCSSLDEVNTMVDQGKVGSRVATTGTPDKTTHFTDDRSTGITPYPIAAINAGDPLRYGESILRIWVAPYEDKAGNYYQPSILYAVVRPGHWIGNPVQAITSEN